MEDIVAENRNRLLGMHPSWRRIQLKEIAKILNGFPFESARFKKDKGTPLLRIRDILRGRTETFYEGDYDSTFMIQPGDIVVGMDGDFNCATWSGEPALLNQRVCKITPDESHCLKQFLAYVLPGYLAAINATTPSVTVKHLSSRTIADVPLPLPTLKEQQQIVAEIENLFSRLEAGIAALKRVQANLKRYRAAVLKAACEGRLVPTEADLARQEGRTYETGEQLLARILTERSQKWQGRGKYKEPAPPDTSNLRPLPEGWTWATAEQLTDENQSITYGVIKLGNVVPNGVPILRSSNVRHLRLDLQEVKRVSPNIANNFKRTFLSGNEILITVRGTLGGVVVAPTNCSGFNISREVAMLKMINPAIAKTIAIFIGSTPMQSWLMQRTKGIAYTGINIETLKQLPTPLPPLAEQERIVAEVERRLSVIEEQEAAVAASLQRAARLRQSILERAFSGRLLS
jgi:type I restriction enzyme S subunit